MDQDILWNSGLLVLSFFFFLNKFIYLFLAVLGLRYCVRAFSSCGERGATLHCGARASHCGARASHCGGLFCCGAPARHAGFSSCGTQAQ